MADPSRPVTGYPQSQHPNNFHGYPNASAGTNFPYYAPPPQPYYAPPYSNPRTTFVRRLLAIFIAIFIISGIITLVTWLVLRPRLPEFRVDSVNLSNFNVSPNSSLNGNWDVRFTARNPNHKITLYYGAMETSVFYKDQSISDTTMPPFVLGTRNETAIRATFVTASRYVDGWVVEGINWERTVRGNVNLNVRMAGWVGFKAGAWRTRRRFMRVYCGGLPVGVSSSGIGGTLVGGPRECLVGL